MSFFDTESPVPPPGARAGLRQSMLRLLPPPRLLRPLARMVPQALQRDVLRRALSYGVAPLLADHTLDLIRGRALGIEVSDLGLSWVLEMGQERMEISSRAAEATVSGSATDLLLLASRLEDADTLFFQRRLQLTGDTELGLTVRNLLDRLPWEAIPRSLRVALHHAARLAREAREARRAGFGVAMG